MENESLTTIEKLYKMKVDEKTEQKRKLELLEEERKKKSKYALDTCMSYVKKLVKPEKWQVSKQEFTKCDFGCNLRKDSDSNRIYYDFFFSSPNIYNIGKVECLALNLSTDVCNRLFSYKYDFKSFVHEYREIESNIDLVLKQEPGLERVLEALLKDAKQRLPDILKKTNGYCQKFIRFTYWEDRSELIGYVFEDGVGLSNIADLSCRYKTPSEEELQQLAVKIAGEVNGDF